MSLDAIPAAPREAPARSYLETRSYLEWSPVVLGALAATALSFILLTFGATVGLGVSSTAPTWRDASVALWILSGLYLIIQAILSFGFGGYLAGRVRTHIASAVPEDTEHSDGLHGLAAWSLAVVMGAALITLVGGTALSRSSSSTTTGARTSAAEPLLSYELDRLFRAGRHAPAADLSGERAEAGRILLTTSGHNGISADDRTYLVQLIGATTGLPAAEAERRVSTVIANSATAIKRSRRSTVILAFSIATALLLGAVAAWAAAVAGGSHRDGAPIPEWMTHSNTINRRRTVLP
jgi:hypothetical protein